MRQIKNTELLYDIDELTIIRMDIAAMIHKTKEGINFKIVGYDNEKIIIQVVQHKTASGFLSYPKKFDRIGT